MGIPAGATELGARDRPLPHLTHSTGAKGPEFLHVNIMPRARHRKELSSPTSAPRRAPGRDRDAGELHERVLVRLSEIQPSETRDGVGMWRASLELGERGPLTLALSRLTRGGDCVCLFARLALARSVPSPTVGRGLGGGSRAEDRLRFTSRPNADRRADRYAPSRWYGDLRESCAELRRTWVGREEGALPSLKARALWLVALPLSVACGCTKQAPWLSITNVSPAPRWRRAACSCDRSMPLVTFSRGHRFAGRPPSSRFHLRRETRSRSALTAATRTGSLPTPAAARPHGEPSAVAADCAERGSTVRRRDGRY